MSLHVLDQLLKLNPLQLLHAVGKHLLNELDCQEVGRAQDLIAKPPLERLLAALALVGLVRLDLEVRRRRRAIDALLRGSGLPEDARARTSTLLHDQLRLTRDLQAWEVTGRLFRYWHLFHRPLATAMYLLVALHVLNAVLLGGAMTKLFTAPG